MTPELRDTGLCILVVLSICVPTLIAGVVFRRRTVEEMDHYREGQYQGQRIRQESRNK